MAAAVARTASLHSLGLTKLPAGTHDFSRPDFLMRSKLPFQLPLRKSVQLLAKPKRNTNSPLATNNKIARAQLQSKEGVRFKAAVQAGYDSWRKSLTGVKDTVGKVAVASAATLALILMPYAEAQASMSKANEVQVTVLEAWSIAKNLFVDPALNHTDWDSLLRETMAEIRTAKSVEGAYAGIKTMLGNLGDPFTRFATPKEYESFRIGNDGSLEGVGLMIASDPSTGSVVVLSPVEGGPAARAGIRRGDQLVKIDGLALSEMKGEDVAHKLRGKAGTTVRITVRRSGGETEQDIETQLLRETIIFSPVFATMLPPHLKKDGTVVHPAYIKLSSFSQHASGDMHRAINKMEEQGADEYILDLRDNPGGLVRAGLDVAEMWLDGALIPRTIVHTINRAAQTAPIETAGAKPLTEDPLIVLVNGNSASATEILAGALQDNLRAELVGQQTFGKGRIQSVFELQDGSAMFVTVAKYLSPNFHPIDKIGIAPDIMCIPSPGDDVRSDYATADDPPRAIEKDSCVIMAERHLHGF